MLSVVIPTYKRPDLLDRVLCSLGVSPGPPGLAWEVLVVDNSTEHEAEPTARGHAPRLPIRYACESEPGVSAARNRGLSQARGDTVWFLDDDVEVKTTWLCGVVDGLASAPGAGFFAGGVTPDIERSAFPAWVVPTRGGPESHVGTYLFLDLGEVDRPLDADEPLVSANLGLRRWAVERAGGFRNDLCPVGSRHRLGGDTDLHQRLVAAGVTGRYLAGAAVAHHTPACRLRRSYALRWSYHHGWSSQYLKALRQGRAGDLGGVFRATEVGKNAIRLAAATARVAASSLAADARRAGALMRLCHRWGRLVASFARRPDPSLDWPTLLFEGPGIMRPRQ